MALSRFEWFVAWRHLREAPERRSRRTLVVGVVAVVIGLGWLVLGHLGPHALRALTRGGSMFALLIGQPDILAEYLKTAGVVAIAVGLLLTVLGALLANFTVFTAISIFGVFLGTGAPIVALSVMSGFEADLKSKIRATKADVVVSTADDHPFTDWQAAGGKIASVDGVTAWMAYVESEVIIKHASNPAGMGIILRGIDAPRAGRVLDLERTLAEGKVDYLIHPDRIPPEDGADSWAPTDDADSGSTKAPTKDSTKDSIKESTKAPAKDSTKDLAKAPRGAPADEPEVRRNRPRRPPTPAPTPKPAVMPPGPSVPGILLGDELYARTLHVFVGSDVDIACPMCGIGPTGPMPKLKSFRVAGHFYTGMYEFDSKLAYVSLPEAQKFLGMQDEVTGIEVRTVNADRAHDVAEAISARLGPGYEVRSWEELNRGLFMALKLEKIAMFVVLTFIALVASFSIVSNLIMLVTEKGREVAILKSMGARDRAILRIFFAEGLYIGLLGLALGLTFGVGGCLLISRFGLPLNPDVYYIQKLPVVMRLGEISSVGLAALGLCCLATLYPAYLASRMRPVEGLRYE